MDRLLYGVAYYDEYMPCDRLDKDVEMIKAAGINLVRIAESTWSTCEPQEGVFDFSHVTRVLDAMEAAGIVSTPEHNGDRTVLDSASATIAHGSLVALVGESGGGKYLGLTITVQATSREQLDDLYRALSTHPMAKWVL